MQIDCFRAKIMFVIAIIGAIATISTLLEEKLAQEGLLCRLKSTVWKNVEKYWVMSNDKSYFHVIVSTYFGTSFVLNSLTNLLNV